MMEFKEICQMKQEQLKSALETELKNKGYKVVNEDGFLYAEGTYPVLLIAHMDTVHHDRCTIICESADGYIMSPQGIGGDDRCGIYMVLSVIEDIPCSVVFTEDEEIGCVGARKFASSSYKPEVNYIIEFDRKNSDDAVFYDCDNPEFTKFITDESIGFKEASGSCSDISHIAPALGVAAVNLSCGYYNQHTQHEYVNSEQMENNIRRAKEIILKESGKFEYIKKVYKYTCGYKSYGSYDYDYDYGYGYGYRNITSASKNNKSTSQAKDFDDFDYVLPEPPIDIYSKIEYGLGVMLSPISNYIIFNGEKISPEEPEEYLVDESGKVYHRNEETEIYYPLISDIKAYNKDGSDFVYSPIDEEEFAYIYYADIEKIMDYVDELSEFDEQNQTDFATDFLEELYMLTTYGYGRVDKRYD